MITLGYHDHIQFGISKIHNETITVVIGKEAMYSDVIDNDTIYYCGQNIPNYWKQSDGVFVYEPFEESFRYKMLNKIYRVTKCKYGIDKNNMPTNIIFTLQ